MKLKFFLACILQDDLLRASQLNCLAQKSLTYHQSKSRTTDIQDLNVQKRYQTQQYSYQNYIQQIQQQQKRLVRNDTANPELEEWTIQSYDFSQNKLVEVKVLKEKEKVGYPALYLLIPGLIGMILAAWQVQRYYYKDVLLKERKCKLFEEDPINLFEYPFEELEVNDFVFAEGYFDNEKAIFYGPRSRIVDGKFASGFMMVSPFTSLDRKQTVLALRGWVPKDYKNSKVERSSEDSSKVVQIEGVLNGGEASSITKNTPSINEYTYLERKLFAKLYGIDPSVPVVEVTTRGVGNSMAGELDRLQNNQYLIKGAKQEEVEASDTPEDEQYAEMYKRYMTDLYTYPLPRILDDLIRFKTMPSDHLQYAALWAAIGGTGLYTGWQAFKRPGISAMEKFINYIKKFR